ncbi:MAG: hypothetical protein PHQ23_03240 [Candidatus Wallbacteria bacterium]|nr:hypothetical protein [Candidatus Wallbacteria bacterium]
MENLLYPGDATNACCRMDVWSDGQVKYRWGGSNGHVTLSQISFRAEQ